MQGIVGNEREGKEWALVIFTILSFLPRKKVKKIEEYKHYFRSNFKYYK